MIGRKDPCPCGSGEKFKRCCAELHDGARLAVDPVALLRGRYTAYVVGAVAYLIDTTDPEGGAWQGARGPWAADLAAYCRVLQGVQLRVLSHQAAGDVGRVRYVAELRLQGRPVTLAEDARYRRVEGRWLYSDGDRFSP